MMDAPSNADTVPAWRAYFLGAAMALPGLAAWLFSSVFILPTVMEVWKKAGLDGKKPQWLMDGAEVLSANGFIDNGKLILLVVVLFFVIMESAVRGWSRYRRWTILVIAYAFNILILVEMLITSTSAVLAARALAKF
jgi:hypothetical protein